MNIKQIIKNSFIKNMYHSCRDMALTVDSLLVLLRGKRKKQKKDKKITVVFMCQYIPAWNKMKPIYEKMKADKRFRPILLCIPLDIKDNVLGSEENDVYEYFVSENYTDAVDAMVKKNGTISWRDIRKFSPDYVFYGRPYNSYMPKEYTSKKVAGFSKVCLVMYSTNVTRFALDTTLNRNFLAYTSIYFATSNELVNINTRRNRLAHMLGLSKTYNCGLLPMEEIIINKSHPYNSWEWSQKPFRVMWTPRWTTDPAIGGSNFFRYKEVLYEYASRHPKIDFLFRPHPMMWDNFIKTGELTEADRDEYIRKCTELGNIRFDDNKEYIGTLWNTTVLVSDISGIMTEYFATGQPLIFCESDIKMSLFKQGEAIMNSCYRVSSEQELIKALDELGKGNDSLKEKREKIVRSFINKKNLPSSVIIEHLCSDMKR